MKKEKRGFSLPKRLIALFLAVAMVLGVLYFGNRKERTATADESVPDGEAFTDDDYFSGLIGGQEIKDSWMQDWSSRIFVPTKNLIIALPEAQSQPGSRIVYVDSETGELNPNGDTTDYDINVDYNEVYMFVKSGTFDPAQEVKGLSLNEDPEHGIYSSADLVLFNNFKKSADQSGCTNPFTGEIDLATGCGAPEVEAVFVLQGANIPVVTADVDNAAKDVNLKNTGFGDFEKLDNDDFDIKDRTYGQFSYDLKNAEGTSVRKSSDPADLETYLNSQQNTYDGEYYVDKSYTSVNEGYTFTALVSGNDDDRFTRDFYIDFGDITIQVGSAAAQPGSEYYIGASNVKLSEDVTVTIESNDEIVSAVFDEDGEETCHVTAAPQISADKKTVTAVISATPDVNGTEEKIHFTLQSASGAVKTLEVTLQYANCAPSVNINNVINVVDSTDNYLSPQDDDVYYAAGPDIKIVAGVISQDVIPDGSVKVYVNDVESGTLTKDADSGSYVGTVSITANLTASIKVKAVVSGLVGESDSIDVYYDNAEPEISVAKLTGKVNGVADTEQTPDADGKFADKISVKGNVPFTLALSITEDHPESITVTREERDLDKDDTEAFKYPTTVYPDATTHVITESSTDSFAGKLLRYTVTVKDKAGHETTKQYYVKCAKDQIKITHTMRFIDDTETTASIEGTGKQYGPTNEPGFEVEFTIQSSEVLKQVDFEANGEAAETVTDDCYITTGTEYEYTFSRIVPISFSQEYKDIKLTFTNINDLSKEDTVGVVMIDLTDPNVEPLYIPSGWVDSYKVIIKASADADGDTDFAYNDDMDTSKGDSYASGIKAVYVKQATGKNPNPAYESLTIPASGIIEVDVTPSTDFSGTRFFVYAEDNAGNESDEEVITFYVDGKGPDTKDKDITIGGKSLIALSKNKGTIFGGSDGETKNPKLYIQARDNIGVKYIKVDVTRKYDGTTSSSTAYIYQDSSDHTLYFANTEPTAVLGENFIVAAGTRRLSHIISAAFGDGSDISADVEAGAYDGTYTLKFEVMDNANSSTELTEVSFDLINTAPTNTIEVTSTPKTQEGNVKYYDGDASVKMSVTDRMGKKSVDVTDTNESELKGTASEFSGSAPNFTATGTISKEGQHTMTVQATGRSGLKAPKASAVAVIDLTDPVVTLDYNGTAISSESQFFDVKNAINLAASDTNLMSVEWTVTTTPSDGSEATTETMTSAGSFNCTKDATYNVSYTVTDKALRKATGTATFVVDTTAPTNDITVNKAVTPDPAKFTTYYNGYLNSATGTTYRYGQYYNVPVALVFTVTDYNVKSITATDSLTGGPVSLSWSSPDAKGVQTARATITGDGKHVITLSATDNAGNTSSSVAVEFTIDTVKPTLSTTLNGVAYSGMRYLNTDGSVGVYITDTNSDPSDIAQAVVRTLPTKVAESTAATVSEGVQTFNIEADYEITYRATDRAGNVSDPATVSFRVDKTAPELTISGVANKGTSTQEINISYGMREAFYWDMENAEISIFKRVDGGSTQPLRTVKFNADNANDVMSELFTEDGEYSFTFKAADKAGNTAETSYSFILDKNAPLITLSGVSNYDKTEFNVDFAAMINETFYTSNKVELEGKRKDKYGKVTDVDFGTISVNSSNPATVEKKFAEDGIYDITVRATDKAGNSSEQKIHFTIDTENPEISGLEAYDGTVINKFNGVPDVEDMIVDLTVCKLKFYLDGVEYSDNSEISEGSHVFRVEATDEMGHTLSENNEFSFKFDSVAPTILVNGIEEGENLKEAREITVSLQLNEDTLTSVKLNGKDMAIKDNACTFTVDSKGKYDLEITAVDAAGNEAKQTISFAYDTESSWLWLILAIIGAVVVLGGGFFFILAKKRNKDDNRR